MAQQTPHDQLTYKHISPFPSLRIVPPDDNGKGGNMIGHGGAFVLGVHRSIVFKFPPILHFFDCFDDIMSSYPIWLSENSERYGRDACPAEMARRHRKFKMRKHDSVKSSIQHEGEMMDEIAGKLLAQGCIHILQPHIRVEEGLLLPRLRCSLQDRIQPEKTLSAMYSVQEIPPGPRCALRLKIRWAKQIASALGWMEHAGLFHGDLRPANIFLDSFNNAVLADFGSCDYINEYLWTNAEVFCPNEFVVGNARSEQYAFGWILYNIFHGSVPSEFDISDPSKVVFPSLDDLQFKTIIYNSLHLEYTSMSNLEKDVFEEYRILQPWYFRILDAACETAASFSLYCRHAFMQRRMFTIYDELRNARPVMVDSVVERRDAERVQLLYR